MISPVFQMQTHPVSATSGNYPNIPHISPYRWPWWFMAAAISHSHCDYLIITVNPVILGYLVIIVECLSHWPLAISPLPIPLLSSALLSSPLLCPACLWRHSSTLNPARPSGMPVKESYPSFFKSTARNAQLRKAYWKSRRTKNYTS